MARLSESSIMAKRDARRAAREASDGGNRNDQANRQEAAKRNRQYGSVGGGGTLLGGRIDGQQMAQGAIASVQRGRDDDRPRGVSNLSKKKKMGA